MLDARDTYHSCLFLWLYVPNYADACGCRKMLSNGGWVGLDDAPLMLSINYKAVRVF